MTSFELTIAIAIGVMIGTIIGELVQFFIIDGIMSAKREKTDKMFNEALENLKNHLKEKEKDEKNVDNNPFE